MSVLEIIFLLILGAFLPYICMFVLMSCFLIIDDMWRFIEDKKSVDK